MKITPLQEKDFFTKPDTLSGVLIYGNDNNRVDLYTQRIISYLNEYLVQAIDFSAANRLPSFVLSELKNMSMFDDRKLIKLTNVNGNISQELKDVLTHDVGNHYIVMVASELSYNSTIRNYMEKSGVFGVIACYRGKYNDIRDVISNYLEQNSVSYTDELINILQLHFNNNDVSIYSELEKLVLYLGKRKSLEYSDLELCFSTPIVNNSDNLYSAIINKDAASFIRISDILMLHKKPIALIRIMLNYFLRLESTLLLVQDGLSEQNAINQLTPPLFFKQLWDFKAHLKIVHLSELKRIIERLIGLEIMCKTTDLDNKMLFQQVIALSS